MSAGQEHLPPLDVAKAFDGRNILLIGTTGFVGKVALSLLLRRYPNVGKVFALVRPGAGNTAEDRFFKKVATSHAFDPLRELWGDGYDDFMRQKVAPVPGDIGRELCNFEDEHFEAFDAAGGLDVIINSAGLVSFTPALESAIRINAVGARNCLELARKTKAKLVHVSTCYVCGKRDGEIWEDESVVGYFPRRDELLDDDFDAEKEIEDCKRVIDQVRAQSNDRAHISEFREKGAARLRSERRDPDNLKALKLAVARERKLWTHIRLTEIGAERAEHWGWTNTYTYTKSLGEQIILADQEVKSTVVRPAVVESSVAYPSPGWNEGFNTTAPLIYLMMKGHRSIVTGDKTPLDVVPVDHVSAGMLMAAAAILEDRHEAVYQLGTSDSNAVTSRRLTELSALAIRRHHKKLAKEGENKLEHRIRARLEPIPVTAEAFDKLSAPRIKRLADGMMKFIDEKTPVWGAPRIQAMAQRAQDELTKVSDFTGQVTDLVELFKAFTHDYEIYFRCDNIRNLHASLTEHDKQALLWAPEQIDWRDYWFDTHFPGLEKWVFPVLDDEFGAKPRSVYTHKDLLEFFDAATRLNRHRVAMRLVPTEPDAETVVYTYDRVQHMAGQGAAVLRSKGLQENDRVFLMSENRPEWGISYFAILKATATAVPVDSQLSPDEVANLIQSSGAAISLVSKRVAERLCEDLEIELGDIGTAHAALSRWLAEKGIETTLCHFDDILSEAAASDLGEQEAAPRRKGSNVASLIYTSGTTAAPKGVMLTDKNLTAMTAKLSQLFRLNRHDGLLSVLPLHHTFEFSAGFLMPLIHGSQVTYLEDVNPEALSDALKEGNITGMVGVPALWQLLYRKVIQRIADRGTLAKRAFEEFVELNRRLREKTPYSLGLGKFLFFPVHQRLGGRMRLLISGGSALSDDTMKAFRGMGFRLFEGYGMTEASPVITVQRPSEIPPLGSVGRALPGIDVKIDSPNESGVGEVIAKGPTVMKGYYENEEATAEVLKSGWLHTGDLGRMDEKGNLYIVGRKKEMILGSSGENVYPDELEELYGDTDYVKELSIVGLPAGDGVETVAGLIVPDYEQGTRKEVRREVKEHVRSVSMKLPQYKRLRVWHLWDLDLPKTATRKVKRREVIAELQRLESVAKTEGKATVSDESVGDADWLRETIARVCQKPVSEVKGASRLEELGFDSLMFTELGVAIEAAGVALPDAGELTSMATVGDVENHVAQFGTKIVDAPAKKKRILDEDEVDVPEPLAQLGREALGSAQRILYRRYLDTEVTGNAYVPPFGGYIVAANHASHLDMGLVKHSLGEHGDQLVALAAKDYFFEDPIRRLYFENFTNLVPMERHGSLRESLRLAGDIVREGYILLIFPEGTRSESGVMVDFKPSLGYLAMSNRCGILPMYLAGTHGAMPKGRFLPKKRSVAAHIGPFISYEDLRDRTQGMGRAESYRTIATDVERVVRSLAPDKYMWTLGESGRKPMTPVEDV